MPAAQRKPITDNKVVPLQPKLTVISTTPNDRANRLRQENNDSQSIINLETRKISNNNAIIKQLDVVAKAEAAHTSAKQTLTQLTDKARNDIPKATTPADRDLAEAKAVYEDKVTNKLLKIATILTAGLVSSILIILFLISRTLL